MLELGILLAFSAMICWAIGDFLIQKSTRKFGDWEPLLIITAIGAIIVTPFAYKDLSLILQSDSSLFIMLIVGAGLFFAALIDFEALRKGKISVIEPIMTMEVPVAALFAFFVINEYVGFAESLLVISLIAGLILVSFKPKRISSKVWIERGVFLGISAAVLMGFSNFMVGFASRSVNPMVTLWFVNMFTAVSCLFYLTVSKKGNIIVHLQSNKKLLISVSIFDNIAWISFAIAATLIPVTIATAITEGYIAIAALLGILINGELLLKHQKLGLIISITSAILLAYLYA